MHGAEMTLKGLKNRSRASMGSCQGSFCTPDLSRLLTGEGGAYITDINYDGPGSELFPGRLKGGSAHDA